MLRLYKRVPPPVRAAQEAEDRPPQLPLDMPAAGARLNRGGRALVRRRGRPTGRRVRFLCKSSGNLFLSKRAAIIAHYRSLSFHSRLLASPYRPILRVRVGLRPRPCRRASASACVRVGVRASAPACEQPGMER